MDKNMTTPKKYVQELTSFITVEGKAIPVSLLPDNITKEIEVLDSIKRDVGNLAYQLEVLTLAMKYKSHEIATMVNAHFASKESAKEETTS